MADTNKERELAEAPYIGAGVDDLRKERAAEYGQYVATEDIFIGGALAFTPGHPVPATHVRLGIVAKDQVEQVQTATEAKKTVDPPKV
jgi:hypothetical protein